MLRILFSLLAITSTVLTNIAAEQWLHFPADNAANAANAASLPGADKHIILIAADQEYRSEQAMPMLARILTTHHGFDTTVLFGVNDEGLVDPTMPVYPKKGKEDEFKTHSIPGLHQLANADLVIFFPRLLTLPDEQLKHIVDYCDSGKPIIGLRTANHGFRRHLPYAIRGKDRVDFGEEILGGRFRGHHGNWKRDSTRGDVIETQKDHPIVRGVTDIWGPSDVYRTYKEGEGLPEGCTALVMGQPLIGREHGGADNPKKIPLPVAWTKHWETTGGKKARVFQTTMGSARDLESEGLRRLVVNAAYWGLGLEDQITANSSMDIVGEYNPLESGFNYEKLGVVPKPVAAYDVAKPAVKKPVNIIYLMLDEWGYFESQHMGSKDLITPNIDRFAREGMRFSNAYAGAPVCGPTRCALLTGLHAGHMSMRSNGGYEPIRADEPTLGSMLKKAGYATGGFGKWGIGGRGTSGVPETHGFDVFFGYYDQVHAHTYYPQYLIENSKEVYLSGNPSETFYDGDTHAQHAIFDESIAFLNANHDRPFFLYLPWTPPHGLWGIDAKDPSMQLFADKPWTAGQRTENDAKVYAAFMHMMDRQLGQLLDLLKELKIDDHTAFFLCGDNGGQPYFATEDRPHGFFGPNYNPATGERFRAGKGSLYEGGLKVPYYVRWPGVVKPGSVTDHLCYYPDLMPTLAAIAKTESPPTDGLSFLPTLRGNSGAGDQAQHKHMYWEYRGQTALRQGDWKIYKHKGDWELYHLADDVQELNNLASEQPEKVKALAAIAAAEHKPIRPGKVHRMDLIEKDRSQAPHKRK